MPSEPSELDRFMQYLKDKDLCICNFTKTNIIYWPINQTILVANFKAQDAQR